MKKTFAGAVLALLTTIYPNLALANDAPFTDWEKQRFGEIDVNQDNKIDRKEFRATTRGWMEQAGFDENKQIKQTNKKFQRYDKNRDNGLSIEEFVSGNRQSNPKKTKSKPAVKKQPAKSTKVSKILGKANNEKLALGDSAPEALGTDRNGNDIDLKDLQGKVVVVSYWVSWCKPCKKELAILHNLQSKLGADLIKVVAINLKESRQSYKKLMKQMSGLDLTLTHDAKGFIARRYGVEKAPSLFVVDQDGKIRYINHGYKATPVNEVVNTIKRLFNTNN